MPYESIWEENGICQRFWGGVTSPELLEALKDIQNDPRAKHLRYVIRDFLDVEVFDVGVKTLLEGRAFLMLAQAEIPVVVFAIVTNSPQIIQYMNAASSYGIDPYQIELFPSVAEARAWVRKFDLAKPDGWLAL